MIDELKAGLNLPDWVPQGAKHYLAHTEQGAPIRALAREAGCHALNSAAPNPQS
jgi:hypothetical protein